MWFTWQTGQIIPFVKDRAPLRRNARPKRLATTHPVFGTATPTICLPPGETDVYLDADSEWDSQEEGMDIFCEWRDGANLCLEMGGNVHDQKDAFERYLHSATAVQAS